MGKEEATNGNVQKKDWRFKNQEFPDEEDNFNWLLELSFERRTGNMHVVSTLFLSKDNDFLLYFVQYYQY